MADTYFVRRNGKVSGPHSMESIKSAVKSKKITTDDLIAESKDGPWKKLKLSEADSEGAGQPTRNRTTFSTPEESRSALTNCEDCGGTVSKQAKSCPHCGAPVAIQEINASVSTDRNYGRKPPVLPTQTKETKSVDAIAGPSNGTSFRVAVFIAGVAVIAGVLYLREGSFMTLPSSRPNGMASKALKPFKEKYHALKSAAEIGISEDEFRKYLQELNATVPSELDDGLSSTIREIVFICKDAMALQRIFNIKGFVQERAHYEHPELISVYVKGGQCCDVRMSKPENIEIGRQLFDVANRQTEIIDHREKVNKNEWDELWIINRPRSISILLGKAEQLAKGL